MTYLCNSIDVDRGMNKNIKFFAISLLAFIAFSCSEKPTIIGRWTVISMKFDSTVDLAKQKEIQSNINKEQMTYEFTKDGKLITASNSMPKFETTFTNTANEIKTILPSTKEEVITKIVSCTEDELVLDFSSKGDQLISYLRREK